jgi:DNA-binding NtrC family response regulator
MKAQHRILLVDDDAGSRMALSALLTGTNAQVQTAATGENALDILQQNRFDILITDLNLPGVSGIDLLKWARANAADTIVILITGQGSAETAVTAMKEGAFDYITKPLNFNELQIVIDKALEKHKLVTENIYLRQQLRGKYKFANIIGNSTPMQAIFRNMEKIIHTDSTVLILGESGTGKELVARAIHFNSSRKNQPFVAINCGAIPSELLESELFGHIRGAFTGAIADKPGKFEQANNGTIFLDEIGTMPPLLQTKLLRVLQEHEVERVGSGRKIRLDVRVISATNADLEKAVHRGLFRDDLYYRLNVIPVPLPPLRERREDIALLARHFLKKCCIEMSHEPMSYSTEALRLFELYEWPGNVREMENVIERAVALSDTNIITPDDLPQTMHVTTQNSRVNPIDPPKVTVDGVDMPSLLAEIERTMIDEALQLSRGVKARAALLLGLNRTTLVEKMKRLKMGG